MGLVHSPTPRQMSRQKPVKQSNFIDFQHIQPERHAIMVDRDLSHLFDYVQNLPNTPYGAMFGEEISQSVSIGTAGVYVAVPGSLVSGGTSAEFIFQNSKELKCRTTGIYSVVWSMSLNCATNNQDLSGCVMVSGTTQSNTANHAFNGAGASKNSSVSSNGILNLGLNDLVQLSVTNHTATNAVVVEHANLKVEMLTR